MGVAILPFDYLCFHHNHISTPTKCVFIDLWMWSKNEHIFNTYTEHIYCCFDKIQIHRGMCTALHPEVAHNLLCLADNNLSLNVS